MKTGAVMTRPSVAKVFLVDDHPIVRHGLRLLIDKEDDLKVCGEAADSQRALEDIKRLQPDVAVVDISLQGRTGIELIKNLREQSVGVPILVMSMFDEMHYAELVLRAGAQGYLMKEVAPSKLLVAIRRLLQGKIYVSEEMNSWLLMRIAGNGGKTNGSPLEALSARESEVFHLIGAGRSTRQIAEELNLSVKTIETHRAHIMEKLQLSSSTELIQRAVAWVQRLVS
jgi:DNA-binding NarL/FixJ family response regulator